jgi:hypothetical protein
MIANLIRQGINKGIDDTAKIRRAVYKWLGRTDNGQTVQSFVPFGTFGCPQEGTLSILLALNGHEGNIVALEGDPENRIKKECKPGEFGIGNPLTKANMYFKENGDIIIEIPEGMFETVLTKGGYTLTLTEGDYNVDVQNGDAFLKVIAGKKIGLAEDGTNPLAGVVTGECLDPVTGVPFPDKSTTVFARKI